jgi:ASC-1-like (ASCH) protein
LAGATGVHLAILVEPFLSYLLTGRKTIESRFGKTRSAPYRQVGTGDVVFLKRTGGPVVGMLRVDRAEFIELNGDRNWSHVRGFAEALCADETFWKDRREKQYATLVHVGAVKEINPVAVAKRDRRPWVILKGKQSELPGLAP